MKSTLKGVTLGSSGLIARNRCRIMGLHYTAAGSGNIMLLEGGSGGGGGTTAVTINVPGGYGNSAVAMNVPFPGNGVLFASSAYAQITGASSVLIWVEGT